MVCCGRHCSFRACSHGGVGLREVEVPHLPKVRKTRGAGVSFKKRSHDRIHHRNQPPSSGESRCTWPKGLVQNWYFPLKSQVKLRRSSGVHILTVGVFCLTSSQIWTLQYFHQKKLFVSLFLRARLLIHPRPVDHLDYHTHKCTVNSFRTFFNGIFVDVLKVTSAKKLATLVLINSHVGLVGLGAGIQKIQR